MSAPILPFKLYRSSRPGGRPGDGILRALLPGETFRNVSDGVECWLDAGGGLQTTPLLGLATHADVASAVGAAVSAAVTSIEASAPGALDTLKELADALGDDANYAASVTAALAARLRVDGAQGLSNAQQTQGLANLGLSAALLGDGQCYLQYTDPGTVTLMPRIGGALWINGAPQIVPAGGVALSNAGLGAATRYYVYAAMASASTMALEASTTGYMFDGAGHANKTSDPTRRLVGMVYLVAGSPAVFSLMGVLSYFNRINRPYSLSVTQQGTSSSSPALVFTGPTILSWGDEASFIGAQGYMYNTVAGNACLAFAYADGASLGLSAALGNSYGNGTNLPFHVAYWATLSEGAHVPQLYGAVSGGGTAYYIPTLYGMTRG